jgi:hypothetical protein
VSSFVDRLRGVVRSGPSPRPNEGPATVDYSSQIDGERVVHPCDDEGNELGAFGGAAAARRDPADVLDGEWRDRHGQRFMVVERTYSPGYRHGRLAVADTLPPADGPWPRLPLLAGTACGGRMLFVDLETTGLAGGAGSYAFLVGCGWFDGGVFRVRQFFLSSFAGERALLDAVADLATSAGTLVTYNGKSFDMPLMETRFVMNRMDTPFARLPHVDMVHPARRLWRSNGDAHGGATLRDRAAPAHEYVAAGLQPALGAAEGGCRLTTLEHLLCGHRREGDVPGFEIPSRYFHYVRSGDAGPLRAVFEHNRLDLLALALVTAHAAQLLDDGPTAARSAREALGMGRMYQRGGLESDACAAFARAAEMSGADIHTRAEAWRAYAILCRRQRRHEDAAIAWQKILQLRGVLPSIVREATEALAVHHEHRRRDPLAARHFALHSMTLPQTVARRAAVAHRLARLERKLGDSGACGPTLFGAP